jgi:hypothetical protein
MLPRGTGVACLAMATLTAPERKAIAARADRLVAAGNSLKERFVGIDEVIDDLISAMRVWYLMPEVLSRPVIVNLWGMTGVGKTDLVRQLVRELDLQDRFCEVELSNGDTTSWKSSVVSVLESNQLNDPDPKIILFDEIQRFNTLDTEGKPLVNTKFTDFWELLSDGRLSRRDRDDIDRYLADLMYSSRELQRRKDKGEDVNTDEGVSIWEAQQIKRVLASNDDTMALTELSRTQLIERMQTERRTKRVYEPVNHAKSLIIISGNLDEAFTMASMASEADVDADIFHAFTQRITVVDVKRALTSRFKPEQVARFGNVHLIYASLRKADFQTLIARELARITVTTKDRFGIDVEFSDAIAALVYRNGVFPVQGVRPVFSSVADIVETNLATLVFEALMRGGDRIALDHADSRIVGRITKGTRKVKSVELPYVGRLDKVRASATADVVANVSVHEAGHAVAYAVLFGLAPLQLTSRVTSSYAAGFTFPHAIHGTRAQLVAQIKVYLAGGLAEELVFGRNAATIGRESDRESATQLVLDYVRKYGFDEEYQANYTLQFAYEMDKKITDTDAEKMLARLVGETVQLLAEHEELLRALAIELRAAGEMKAPQVAEIASRFGVDVRVEPEAHLQLPSYAAELTPG